MSMPKPVSNLVINDHVLVVTLDAARLGPAARDALGREKSEANRLATRRAMEHYNQYRAPRSEG